MNKLLVVTIAGIIVLGIIGTAMMVLQASYATDTSKKQSKQAPSEKITVQPERQSQQPSGASEETTVQPERQSQQPSGASEETTVQPERQLQFSPEQQDDGNNAIEQKDEQIRDLQEEEDDNENNGDNEERVEIDKKAPVLISGNNVYVVWFNDRNTPNNNSEALFRSSADGGITFADKINLSNTTAADSINAEIAADGSNFIVTWWEHNATSVEPVIRVSADSGATFVPILSLSADGTIGETVEEG
jgi:hypothetical protein